MESFFNEIAKFNYRENIDLSRYNTFLIKSKAKLFIEVGSHEVAELIQILNKYKKEYFILGCGSNVVFLSKVVKKVVIHICDKNTICVRGRYVYCGAGERLSALVNFYYKKGFAGFEWACGIPASVGGAVCQNAGAFNKSMSNFLKSIIFFDGKNVRKLKVEECEMEYRNSLFKKNGYIVLGIIALISKDNKEKIRERMNKFVLVRREKQPQLPSAGSVFKNGENFYAGKIIEELGLKGKRVGGAMVSEKHANFIINYKNASGKDVVKLIKEIKNLAKIKFNATLCEEVVIQ